MAVEIVSHRADGGAEVIHTEAGHTGTVLGTQVQFVKNVDGSTNPDYVLMPCPVCSASSAHPIGGGCQPGEVQKLFARLYMIRAAALGIPPAERGWPEIRALVCSKVEAMDGPNRCYLWGMAGPESPPDLGPSPGPPPGQGP